MGDPTDEKHDIKNSPYWKGPHWGLTPRIKKRLEKLLKRNDLLFI